MKQCPECRAFYPEEMIMCPPCGVALISNEARIAELEAEVRVYKFALENAIIDRTLGGNTPLAQYVAEARAELNRQAQEEK